MPKRPFPDDVIVQPTKKQQNSKSKCRNIRSLSSERSLQLLYQGASKSINKPEESELKCFCSTFVSAEMVCGYCERPLCPQCINLCYKCREGFCPNCSFPTYDQNEAVCYSCYS